jgi:hypothetical protein
MIRAHVVKKVEEFIEGRGRNANAILDVYRSFLIIDNALAAGLAQLDRQAARIEILPLPSDLDSFFYRYIQVCNIEV